MSMKIWIAARTFGWAYWVIYQNHYLVLQELSSCLYNKIVTLHNRNVLYVCVWETSLCIAGMTLIVLFVYQSSICIAGMFFMFVVLLFVYQNSHYVLHCCKTLLWLWNVEQQKQIALFLNFHLCRSVMLNSLSFSFTSISFPTDLLVILVVN